MTTSAEARIEELGLELVAHPMPPGSIVAVVEHGGLAWVSGQPPSKDGKIVYTGPVGDDGLSVEDAAEAARLCTINALAALRAHIGSLDRVARVVKVVGFVQAASGFAMQSRVINVASDLLVDVFGDAAGKHARSAIGVASLPGNMSVEIEMVVALRDDAA